MIVQTNVPVSLCPHCGKKIDGATGDRVPRPGDVSICLACLALNVFTEKLTIEKISDELLFEIQNDPDMWAAICKLRESIKIIQANRKRF